MNIPTLTKVDHLHVYTKNRALSKQWYEDKLGFAVVEKYLSWAEGSGPLVLSNPTASFDFAIFERETFTPSSIIAFGVDGNNFLDWKEYLEQLDLLAACKDHQYTWSLYFNDLDGNGLEITTHDYAYVKQELINNAVSGGG